MCHMSVNLHLSKYQNNYLPKNDGGINFTITSITSTPRYNYK